MANGIQSDRAGIGPINPASLIGQATPVVEPRAVTALSEAFRSGVITADDIMQRAGEAGRTRQKAEIQMLQEQISPEAIAARAQARDAASAQAQLQGAQATAQLPLVQPTAQLAATAVEEQAAVQKYGPGIEYFKALAPEAGIAAPVMQDGSPDYAKRAQLGLQLFEWKNTRERAKERLTPAHWEKSPDGSQLFKFNKQGELITPELERSLSTQAVSTFSAIQPGAVVTAPTPAPAAAAPTTIEITPVQRAAAVEQFGVAPEKAAVMTGSEFQGLVEPRAPVAAQPVIEPNAATQPTVPGATAFLGPAKTRPANRQVDRTDADELATMQADKAAIAQARTLLSESNVVGPGAGSAPVRALNQVGAALGFRTEEFESQDRLLQLINRRVLEGAKSLKGNLSDKDIRFLQESFPSLRSTESTWTNFLDKWDQMLNLNEQIIRGAAPRGSSIFDAAKQATPAAPATAPAATSGGVLNLPSTGRRIVRDANGTYRLVQ